MIVRNQKVPDKGTSLNSAPLFAKLVIHSFDNRRNALAAANT